MPRYPNDGPFNILVSLLGRGKETARKRRIKFRRGSQYFRRKKEDNLLHFFDCGQYFDETAHWADIRLTVDTGYILTPSTGETDYPDFDLGNFELDQWQEWASFFFDIPVEEWENTYREIEGNDAYKYGVSVYNGRGEILSDGVTVDPANVIGHPSNPDWSNEGYKPVDKDKIWIQSLGGLCIPWDLYNIYGTFKVTASNNYSADPVTIDLSKGGNVFLLPHPLFVQESQEHGIDSAFIFASLWCNFAIKSRELFLQKTVNREFDGGDEVPLFWSYYAASISYHSNGTWMFDFDHTGTELSKQIVDWAIARGALNYVQRGSFASHTATFGFEPATNFPYPGSGPQADVQNMAFAWTIQGDLTNVGSSSGGILTWVPGILCAVIQQKNRFYYVWSTSVSSTSYGFGWSEVGGSTTP